MDAAVVALSLKKKKQKKKDIEGFLLLGKCFATFHPQLCFKRHCTANVALLRK